MKTGFDSFADGDTFDVAVIGAGAAGLGAALFAALQGARVLVVEHTPFVGGTTAMSAGTTWIPGTQHAATVNATDTLAEAARYLDNAVGHQSPAALRQTFLDNGADVVRRLEADTEVKFRPYPKHPDYISDLGGSTLSGRALEPLPFDGRLLGPLFKLLRLPIPEFTVLGGMMVDRTDVNHLLALTKSWASFSHAVRILFRHGLDRLSYPRGTRLVMGNALVARLLYSLSKHNSVALSVETSVAAIRKDGAGIAAVTLTHGTRLKDIKVTGGVILASGGFNLHAQKRGQRLPGVQPDWCPGAPGHTGEAQDLALALGAQFGASTGGPAGGQAATPAFWAPVSLRRRPDGTQAVFPHFVMDRAKPGMVTVNQAGRRFVNESTSYHLFALAMQAVAGGANSVPAYLVCDADALRRYGVGMVRPGGKGLAPFLADGYLTEADSLAGLAQKLDIPADALQATVARFNQMAADGVDTDFHRGETAYQQNIGDPAWPGKNPNLGALQTAPFYAVRLYPGDIGASTGLVCDGHARVLDAAGQPIAGLYAAGNDMNSIMGGVYPAPGITLGPALVFGALAASHAVQRARGAAR